MGDVDVIEKLFEPDPGCNTDIDEGVYLKRGDQRSWMIKSHLY